MFFTTLGKIQLVQELDREIENLSQINLPIVLAADFNNDALSIVSNNLLQSYLDSITTNSLNYWINRQLEIVIPHLSNMYRSL